MRAIKVISNSYRGVFRGGEPAPPPKLSKGVMQIAC